MKLSKGKVTYPGRKQVFRVQDKRGRFIKDILGLGKEKIRGRPLLLKFVDKGRVLYKLPSLNKSRLFAKNNLARLPERFKDVRPRHKYPVLISPHLKRLRQALTHQLEKRQ
jgi:nicotinate phosphoribosyltransferase